MRHRILLKTFTNMVQRTRLGVCFRVGAGAHVGRKRRVPAMPTSHDRANGQANGHRAASLIQPSLLGRMNERQVLRVIQEVGTASRADVTRRTGISAPTVSKAVATLLRGGLLEEFDAPELARGRPARRLRLASESAQVLGLVIDVGECRALSAGLDGKLHEERTDTFPTPRTYAGLIDALTDRAARLMDRAGVSTLGVGISMPGLIDFRREQGVLSPNLPITDGHRPSRDLAGRLGVDCVLLQETHALCLAERHHGLARGLADFAMLDVSTGVGLGVMSGGQLLRGNRGLAGEVGHVTAVANGRPCGCGNRGCLETVASDSALAWRVSRRLRRTVTIDDMVAGVKAGKLSIKNELAETCGYLAVGLAAVINLFNPSTLFVHGRMFELDDDLFDRVCRQTRQRCLGPSFADCRIVQAGGSKRQGAVAGIIQHLTRSVMPDL
jgi:predicted NBD/HSP70 family sugar kinase